MSEYFGRNLRKYRRRINKSHRTLAIELGCDVRTISAWECGERDPKLSHLDRIAEAVRCTRVDLIR